MPPFDLHSRLARTGDFELFHAEQEDGAVQSQASRRTSWSGENPPCLLHGARISRVRVLPEFHGYDYLARRGVSITGIPILGFPAPCIIKRPTLPLTNRLQRNKNQNS